MTFIRNLFDFKCFKWPTILLTSLIGAEILILALGNNKNYLSSFIAQSASFGKWLYGYVGPVVFPLALLTLSFLYITFKLFYIFFRGTGEDHHLLVGYFKRLEVIENVSPAFGFLGTVLALISVMAGIDPGLSQGDMLKALLNNSSSAFGSTVYGIVMMIIVHLIRKEFQDFLLSEKLCMSEGGVTRPEQSESGSKAGYELQGDKEGIMV